MAAAALASAVGGGMVSAAGQVTQGQEDKWIADYNAQIAENDSNTVMAQGEEEARRSMINAQKVMGSAMANYGASGVSGGSELWAMRSNAQQAELNSLTIKNNAEIKADAYLNEANLDKYRGANQQQAADIGAATSLMLSGSKAMSSFSGGSSSDGGGG